MHGASDEKKLELLHSIYDSGARAVCLEARPHPDFVGALWWHDVEVAAIKEFENLSSGTEYDALYEAALCRDRAAWIVGINAT